MKESCSSVVDFYSPFPRLVELSYGKLHDEPKHQFFSAYVIETQYVIVCLLHRLVNLTEVVTKLSWNAFKTVLHVIVLPLCCFLIEAMCMRPKTKKKIIKKCS